MKISTCVLFILILALTTISVTAVDFIPSGNVSGRNLYSIKNFTAVCDTAGRCLSNVDTNDSVALASEISNRQSADSLLATQINNNMSGLSAIYATITNMNSNDTAIRNIIASVVANLSSENVSRQGNDTLLSSNIASTVSNLSGETTNRQGNDTALSNNIASVVGNLSSENVSRQGNDTALRNTDASIISNLSNEALYRSGNDTALGTRIDNTNTTALNRAAAGNASCGAGYVVMNVTTNQSGVYVQCVSAVGTDLNNYTTAASVTGTTTKTIQISRNGITANVSASWTDLTNSTSDVRTAVNNSGEYNISTTSDYFSACPTGSVLYALNASGAYCDATIAFLTDISNLSDSKINIANATCTGSQVLQNVTGNKSGIYGTCITVATSGASYNQDLNTTANVTFNTLNATITGDLSPAGRTSLLDPNGLVSYWNLNASKNLTDLMGLNNLSLADSAGYLPVHVTTPIDMGYNFTYNKYTELSANDSASLSVTGAFTIGATVNISRYGTTSSRNIIIGKYYNDSGADRSILLGFDHPSGTCAGNFTFIVSSRRDSLNGTTLCTQWDNLSNHFNQTMTIVATYTPGGNQSVYVNGVLIGTNYSSATSVADGLAEFSLMSGGNNYTDYVVNGVMEEAFIYNRSWSADEVKHYHNNIMRNKGMNYNGCSGTKSLTNGYGQINTTCASGLYQIVLTATSPSGTPGTTYVTKYSNAFNITGISTDNSTYDWTVLKMY